MESTTLKVGADSVSSKFSNKSLGVEVEGRAGRMDGGFQVVKCSSRYRCV